MTVSRLGFNPALEGHLIQLTLTGDSDLHPSLTKLTTLAPTRAGRRRFCRPIRRCARICRPRRACEGHFDRGNAFRR